ncbi:class I SAM-dependent methyltransferase [Modestobacter sp. SYSU DS0511]
MSERDVAAVYDQVADDYADHFPSTEPEQQIELAMVAHFASLLPGTKEVLDAGCGAGRMLPVLAGVGCRPVGIDLSTSMIRRARQDHPDVVTRVGSIGALPFPDDSFDGLFSWYSTIHTPDADLGAVFGEARRVLRPGGHVLVAFQAGAGVQEVGQGYRRLGHDVVLHRYDRTPDQVAGELRSAGLAEVARLVRAPAADERTDQAVLVARSTREEPGPALEPLADSSTVASSAGRLTIGQCHVGSST